MHSAAKQIAILNDHARPILAFHGTLKVSMIGLGQNDEITWRPEIWRHDLFTMKRITVWNGHTQLMVEFSYIGQIWLFLCILKYQLMAMASYVDTSYHFWLYLYFLNYVPYFSQVLCTNSFHRRNLCTFYSSNRDPSNYMMIFVTVEQSVLSNGVGVT